MTSFKLDLPSNISAVRQVNIFKQLIVLLMENKWKFTIGEKILWLTTGEINFVLKFK